jgi:hypothetical protein
MIKGNIIRRLKKNVTNMYGEVEAKLQRFLITALD